MGKLPAEKNGGKTMQKRQKVMIRAGAVLLSLSLAGLWGCSSPAEQEKAPGAVTTAQEAAETRKSVTYPVKVSTYDSSGQTLETTYRKAPERVLAVHQNNVESMIALGQAGRLSAIAGLDHELPSAMRRQVKGVPVFSGVNLTNEQLAQAGPDMILGWGTMFQENTLGSAREWVESGINIYIEGNTRVSGISESVPAGTIRQSVDSEVTDLTNLGRIFDCQDSAGALIEKVHSEESSVSRYLRYLAARSAEERVSRMEAEQRGETARAADTSLDLLSPTVLVVTPTTRSAEFTLYGSSSLAGDMVDLCGGKLLLGDRSTAASSDLTHADPDVLLVVSQALDAESEEDVKQASVQELLDNPSLQGMSAIRNQRVCGISLYDVQASGYRTAQGLARVAEALYPGYREWKQQSAGGNEQSGGWPAEESAGGASQSTWPAAGSTGE